MSISILKRSLEIVDEDETKKKQKKKTQRKTNNLFDFEEKEKVTFLFDCFVFLKLSSCPQRTTRKNILEVKKDIKEKSEKANKNVEKLLKLSKTKVESTTAQKVAWLLNTFFKISMTSLFPQLLQRARTGKYVLDTEKPQEELSHQESVFTEEDFAMFEKEFDG